MGAAFPFIGQLGRHDNGLRRQPILYDGRQGAASHALGPRMAAVDAVCARNRDTCRSRMVAGAAGGAILPIPGKKGLYLHLLGA